MSRLFAFAAVVLVLAATGCGDDGGGPQEETSGAGATTGAEGREGLTAAEFLPLLLPEKERAVEEAAAGEPACEGLRVKPPLILVVSDAASKTDPETPLSELVAERC
jgi:hypothetical protein